MRDDWFLKWFFRILVVSLIFIFWLASSVYSSSWEDYLKQEVVGDKTVWYDNSILLQTPYRAMDPQELRYQYMIELQE